MISKVKQISNLATHCFTQGLKEHHFLPQSQRSPSDFCCTVLGDWRWYTQEAGLYPLFLCIHSGWPLLAKATRSSKQKFSVFLRSKTGSHLQHLQVPKSSPQMMLYPKYSTNYTSWSPWYPRVKHRPGTEPGLNYVLTKTKKD